MRPADQRETDMMGLHGLSGLAIGSVVVIGLTGTLVGWPEAGALADFGGESAFGGLGVTLEVLKEAPGWIKQGMDAVGGSGPAAPTAGP